MRRPAASELLAWALVGAAVGAAAGLALGEFYGPETRRRIRRLGKSDPEAGPEAAPLRPRELVRAVRAALAREPELAALDIAPLPVGPGVVELHGWVPSRALRGRAVRAVREVPGVDSLVNCLLVEGEDAPFAPADAPADQSA